MGDMIDGRRSEIEIWPLTGSIALLGKKCRQICFFFILFFIFIFLFFPRLRDPMLYCRAYRFRVGNFCVT